MAAVARAARPFYLEDEARVIMAYGVQFPNGQVVIQWLPLNAMDDAFIDTNESLEELENELVATDSESSLVQWGAPGLVVIEKDGLHDVVERALLELTKLEQNEAFSITELIMTRVEVALRVGGEMPDGSIDPM